MKTPRLFVPITKVDESQRMVYGLAAIEEPDKSGEIFDFESSAPHFKAWSESFSKATDGKSLGNVRAMHANISAGVLKQFDLDYAAKSIPIAAYINDDAEWKKVLDGNYTGFSIGGHYEKKWKDGDLTRYTATPTEVSIVDNPCIPSATFAMVKADGSEELRKFKGREVKQFWSCGTVGHEHAAKADAIRCDGDEETAEKRDFSTDERKKMAESGEAMSDGSYPIKSAHDVSDAVKDYNRTGQSPKVKAHIIARAKAIGATSALPDDWKKFAGCDLEKGMGGVAMLSCILADFDCFVESCKGEADYEGDNSPLPAAAAVEREHLAELLRQYTEEETGELTADTESDDMAQAAPAPVTKGIEMETETPAAVAPSPDPPAPDPQGTPGETVEKGAPVAGSPEPAPAAKAEPTEIQKAFDSRVADLEKGLSDIAKSFEEKFDALVVIQKEFMEKFLRMPAPPKASITTVTKADDSRPTEEPETGDGDTVRGGIKKAFAEPRRVI